MHECVTLRLEGIPLLGLGTVFHITTTFPRDQGMEVGLFSHGVLESWNQVRVIACNAAGVGERVGGTIRVFVLFPLLSFNGRTG
jgi:hypothetical protein